MKIGILLAFLFLFFLLFENSGFHAFGGILVNIPLLIIAGMMIAQRVGPGEGAVWFLMLFAVTGDSVALFLFCFVPLLIVHLFTTRSVYALLGLGIVSWIIASFGALIISGSIDRLFHTHLLPAHFLESVGIRGILIIPGLFLGVFLVHFIERHVFSRITFRASL